MNEIAQIEALLKGDHGWSAAILGWMSALRIFAKMFSEKLQAAMTRALATAIQSKDDKVDAIVTSILGNGAFRICAWLVDTVFSIKFPTLTTYNAAKAKCIADANCDTAETTKRLNP